MVIWITGLSGAGKTTISTKVCEQLKLRYSNVVHIDGDIIRKVLGCGGYTRRERLAIAGKITDLCKFLEGQKIIVICSTIGLFNEIHQKNRKEFLKYYEIFIDVSMDELQRRDKKNLYSDALSGKIKNVVGVDIDYDIPKNPFLVVDNDQCERLTEKVNGIVEKIYESIDNEI